MQTSITKNKPVNITTSRDETAAAGQPRNIEHKPDEDQESVGVVESVSDSGREPTGPVQGHAAGDTVIMFDGSLKRVEEIACGDTLLGDDSLPRTVQSLHRGSCELYRIYPSKGDPMVVTGTHTLCLKKFIPEDVTELTVNAVMALKRPQRKDFRLFRTGVEFATATQAIDPYFLGVWLGDGTTSRTEITTMDPEVAEYVTNYASERGLRTDIVAQSRGSKARAYRITRIGTSQDTNSIRDDLNRYGLCRQYQDDKGGDKFIPQDFLIADRTQRRALLAGLIDTDGCRAQNGVYEVTFAGMELADGIRFLARSLGYLATSSIKPVDCSPYYRTFISGAYDLPLLVPRRRGTAAVPGSMCRYGAVQVCANPLKTKFAVIPEGRGNFYGFTLDGNHRYLMHDFTVTRDSALG